MDIERALDSIQNNVSCEDFSKMKEHFISGYKEAFHISEEIFVYMPMFKRFADLYGYVKILVSSCEAWDNEPEWLINLRHHMQTLMNLRSKHFGESPMQI